MSLTKLSDLEHIVWHLRVLGFSHWKMGVMMLMSATQAEPK